MGDGPRSPTPSSAAEVLERARRRTPVLVPSVIVVSDGRPTVGVDGFGPVESAEEAFRRLVAQRSRILLVTAEPPYRSVGLLRQWAECWKVPMITLEQLRARRVRRLLQAG